MLNLCYVYYLSKLTEFADTIFFVLKKKKSQLTWLHLYHHSLTPLEAWILVKFLSGNVFYRSIKTAFRFKFYSKLCNAPLAFYRRKKMNGKEKKKEWTKCGDGRSSAVHRWNAEIFMFKPVSHSINMIITILWSETVPKLAKHTTFKWKYQSEIFLVCRKESAVSLNVQLKWFRLFKCFALDVFWRIYDTVSLRPDQLLQWDFSNQLNHNYVFAGGNATFPNILNVSV